MSEEHRTFDCEELFASGLLRVFTRAGAVRLVARTSRTDGRRRVVRERRVLQQNAARGIIFTGQTLAGVL